MSSYDITKLGDRLLSLRENHKLTQKDLSSMIGLTPKMISFYENNQRTPPADVLIKLSSIFNVTVDYFLGANTENKIVVERSIKTSFGPDALDLLNKYSTLNESGKTKVIQYMNDLYENPKNLSKEIREHA